MDVSNPVATWEDPTDPNFIICKDQEHRQENQKAEARRLAEDEDGGLRYLSDCSGCGGDRRRGVHRVPLRSHDTFTSAAAVVDDSRESRDSVRAHHGDTDKVSC